MKFGVMVMILALLAISARAQELMPVPDMSSAKVPTDGNEEAVATKPVEATTPALSAQTLQEITSLAKQLGDNDTVVRRQAKDKLKAMGQQARPVLLQYTNATNAEVLLNVRELMEAATEALLRQAREMQIQAQTEKEIGHLESARNQFSKAAALFEKAAREAPRHPSAPRAALVAAQNHMRAENPAAAIRCFENLIAAYPEAPENVAEANFWLGICHERSKDYVSAARVFNKLALDFPESKWAKYARGQLARKEFEKRTTGTDKSSL